ncbi:Kelch repeat-containing protein [Parachitinimonas caeni]|uniref:Uncharacterized protein n=1 Tax=Parachitinimonas caeni TaxID=3031301 RepID=A0ABT7E2H0_9NEIS|nr:hypothetical protein [Parachitinimonas caeni]MDK2126514.1 hypothetical protein [Parachitinimonas caeni]
MLVDKNSWERYFKGFSILDVTSSKPTRFWFALIENYGTHDPDLLPRTRIVSINTERPIENRFIVSEYAHFDKISLAFQSTPFRDVIGIDLRCNVYSFNEKFNGEENPVNTRWLDNKRAPAVSRAKQINGVVYAIAGDRMLFKRADIEQWQLDNDLPRPTERISGNGSVLDFGFNDAAAFPNGEMYAVGGRGDVWHYRDGDWRQLPFPSNEKLDSVCCAGDGNVYISGHGGTLWAGKENKWENIVKEEWSTVPIKDMEWFDGKLWLGNEYGLWYLKDKTLHHSTDLLSGEVAACCGRIDLSSDGKQLLSASPIGAALYDGEKWEILFNTLEFA